MSGKLPIQHASAAELVRSMTRANRVDSTHIRTVLVHVEDRRGVLEALLDQSVLRRAIKINTAEEARTVEAFACQLMGTSFHALTFSLRPDTDQKFPVASALAPVETGKLRARLRAMLMAQAGGDLLESERHVVYDTARRSTSQYDGMTPEEFLVEDPRIGDLADPAAANGHTSFRDVVLHVTGLSTRMEFPLSFVHAPVATPAPSDLPRGVTGPCLRFGVAFPRFDDSNRFSFGTRLVDVCCEQGYGLWQRQATGGGGNDYWEPVVPPRRPVAGWSVDAAGEVLVPGDLPGTATGTGRGADVGPGPGGGQALAVSCVGPVRPGTTDAIMRVLVEANAPLLGMSETWLDDLSMIHLLTRTPLARGAVPDGPAGQRADAVLSRALGLPAPVRDDRLRDYRALVSPRDQQPSVPGLAALWVGWATPATPDALGLTVKTLRAALDGTASRYVGPDRSPREGHCNIEYLVCREAPGADRLHGRMRVAVDLDALGVTRGEQSISGAKLGRFCSDLERLWRKALSFGLGTTHVDLEVVWRESWLGRWAPLRGGSHDDHW